MTMLPGNSRSRAAITFTEILVGVAILGLAMAPVVGMIVKTFSQIRAEKSEAAASNYAGKLLNQVLFELSYGELIAKTNTPTFKFTGTDSVDGADLSWTVEIQEVNGITFRHKKPEYHNPNPHVGGEPASPIFKKWTDSSDIFKQTAGEIDSKFAGTTVLCDVKLTIQWKNPGDAGFDNDRKQVLYTRKARLE